MATFRCRACLAMYQVPQRDGASYFHACAPTHNAAYDAQFMVDGDGNYVPKAPLDPRIPEMIERPGKRDENVEVKPDGTVQSKVPGSGRDTL